MSPPAVLAVGLTLVLDTVVAEPPTRLHPVAWYGRLLAPLDRDWSRPRLIGVVAPGLAVAVSVVVAVAVHLVGLVDPWIAGGIAGLVLFTTTSRRMLLDEAQAVVTASETDPAAARERLPALAGRNASTLTQAELRSAAVESAAENLSDGLVAPLAAFAVGSLVSLPVGAGAAAFVKAVNTGDSMLGYRSKAVGGPSARLDDLVMYLPARASALLLAVAAGAPASLRRAAAWARIPASPNAGWPMATIAAAVDRRLTKPGQYTLNGAAHLPDTTAAHESIRIVGRAGLLAVLFAGVVAWY